MTDFQGPRCETCKYFYHEGDGETGLCRRLPPTPILIPVNIAKAGKPADFKIQSQFPAMLPSGWCGEHQPQS